MSPSRRPVSFIATSDPSKAKAFFLDVLGLQMVEASEFALVFADGDHMLRVQIVDDFTPPPYTAHGWIVADIEWEIQTLSARGVEFLMFEHMPQDTLGIWTTPDENKIAWFKDPSGNILSLTQMKPS